MEYLFRNQHVIIFFKNEKTSFIIFSVGSTAWNKKIG